MTNKVETFLKERILPDLDKGRPNWDKPHTLCVVMKIKLIIDNNPALKLDDDVLIISAYAHDWGYSGLFENNVPLQLDEVKNAKEEHAILGAERIENLLKNDIFNYLSTKQKARIKHLVFVHDRVEQLVDTDELILMEADTLGGLDIEYVKPTFNKESNERYMKGVIEGRLPKFVTEYSKKDAVRLIDARSGYYDN